MVAAPHAVGAAVRSSGLPADLRSMPHDGDAEDTHLLEQGRIEYLLAKYHDDAEDVAQNVKLRLLHEFESWSTRSSAGRCG